MSSTLFGRGVNAQVGMRRRAEQINRELAEVKAATDDIKDIPRDIYMIKAQVASFEKTVLDHLQALEKRLDRYGDFDARIRALEDKLARPPIPSPPTTAIAAAAAAAPPDVSVAESAPRALPPTIHIIPKTTS